MVSSARTRLFFVYREDRLHIISLSMLKVLYGESFVCKRWILLAIPYNYVYGSLYPRLWGITLQTIHQQVALPRSVKRTSACCWIFSFSSPWKHHLQWVISSHDTNIALSHCWHFHFGNVMWNAFPSENDYMLPAFCHWKGHQIEWGILNKAAFLLQFPPPAQFSALHLEKRGTMSQDVLTSCQYIVIYFFNIEAQNLQFTHSVPRKYLQY